MSATQNKDPRDIILAPGASEGACFGMGSDDVFKMGRTWSAEVISANFSD